MFYSTLRIPSESVFYNVRQKCSNILFVFILVPLNVLLYSACSSALAKDGSNKGFDSRAADTEVVFQSFFLSVCDLWTYSITPRATIYILDQIDYSVFIGVGVALLNSRYPLPRFYVGCFFVATRGLFAFRK